MLVWGRKRLAGMTIGENMENSNDGFGCIAFDDDYDSK
jgi:hypothetical protein